MRKLRDLVYLPRPCRIVDSASVTDAKTVPELVKAGATGMPGAYTLDLAPGKIVIRAADEAGLFYGRMTLRQILRQCPDEVPCGTIEDSPDFADRGVMLDVSRDKVPKLETLFQLVDELAEWKINHLELYFEHTFAYSRHKIVWEDASPITAEEIRKLDAYCRERFIELVPNQNSFGHLRNWLKHPPYQHLAETLDSYTTPWGAVRKGPYSLCPTDPASVSFLDELYGELLPNFASRRFNVGCDETFDLGAGRSRSACEAKGKERVYLEFLLQIHRLVAQHGRTILFWGDVVSKYPDLIDELPKDVEGLVWGYEANEPLEDSCRRFEEAGLRYHVCPGTSSWMSFLGRTDNCISNIQNAVRHGRQHGAIGFLNTDWGDCGHLQYWPASYLGLGYGAALSWCEQSNQEINIGSALDVHVFKDSAGRMGKALFDLGNAYRQLPLIINSSALFKMLYDDDWQQHVATDPDSIRSAQDYIERTAAALSEAKMGRPDSRLVSDELANGVRMMLHACHRGLADLSGSISSADTRKRLADEMRLILSEHRRLWLARNRAGGLSDSVRVLEQRLKEYETA